MHSTASDGTFSAKQLIDMAKKAGLQGISITDHDTVAAYNDEVISYAREKDLLLLPGVEFSCRYEDVSVHVLGYNIDPLSESILDLCLKHIERRAHRNRAILEKLKEKGIELDMAELMKKGQSVIGRPHIASLMQEKGYVSSMQAAFESYIGDDKPCFVTGKPFSIAETIEIIHAAGGKAFFAHPHLAHSKRAVKKILEKHKFDGLEGYYAKFSPKEEKEWIHLADDMGLLVSGGSDFHGNNKPMDSLGSSWVDYEALKKIMNLS